MKAFSIAKKSIFKLFDLKLYEALYPSYILIISFNFFTSSQLWSHFRKLQQDPYNYELTANYWAFSLLGSLAGLIFVVLLISALDDIENDKVFKIPKPKDLAAKIFKVFLVSMISSIFIFLGILCFIIPGIFLSKRYIYVVNIAVQERLGIIESMKRSKELSKRNGWSIYISAILLLIPIYVICYPIVFNSFTQFNSSAQFFQFFISSIITGYVCTIPFYSALFYGYNDAKKLVGEESNN